MTDLPTQPEFPDQPGGEPQTLEPVSPRPVAEETPVVRASKRIRAMRDEITKAVIGQEEVIDQVLVALLAAGHVLIEGVPGLGKTLLVRALAKTFSGLNGRIQFTPDLMPSDVIGHVMYNMQQGRFNIRRGPVFTNILLADEINRAPAKTQAALLEAMQERQVTLEGSSMLLPAPFMTLATQNPVEQEGTYNLPEAQLDRFLLKVRIDYPDEGDEIEMVEKVISGSIGDAFNLDLVQPVVSVEEVALMQKTTASLNVDKQVTDYAVKLVRATRDWPGVMMGAGPRGSLAILRAARAYALLNERDFVIPDDIKTMAFPVLRHRLILAPDLEIEGKSTDALLSEILTGVEAPRI